MCPNFYRDPRGIIFETNEQYGWAHSFYEKEGWESTEPKFATTIKDMFKMARDPERRVIKQNCRLCHPNHDVNTNNQPFGPLCDQLFTNHFDKFHKFAKWHNPIPCPKCGRDLAIFTEKFRKLHIEHHSQKPECNEEYYTPGEQEANMPFTSFPINLKGL